MDARQVRGTYRWMAPLYDPLFSRAYARMRASSIRNLRLDASDRVLLVGIGTGLDLKFMPAGATVVGVDISPAMLRRASKRQPRHGSFLLANGSALPLATESMSAVVLHLVLGVTGEPNALLREAARVLKPGGRVAILDHFAPRGDLGIWRTLLSRTPRLLGTHMDRRFEDLEVSESFTVASDRLLARGFYRSLMLVRT